MKSFLGVLQDFKDNLSTPTFVLEEFRQISRSKIGSADFEGPLERNELLLLWRPVYWVVKGPHLFQFPNTGVHLRDTYAPPLNVNLIYACSVEDSNATARPFCFKLRTPTDTFDVSAPSEEIK